MKTNELPSILLQSLKNSSDPINDLNKYSIAIEKLLEDNSHVGNADMDNELSLLLNDNPSESEDSFELNSELVETLKIALTAINKIKEIYI